MSALKTTIRIRKPTMNLLDPFFYADIIGIVFFAISGALIAIRSKLDLLGLLIAANLTALGGGVIRDVIVDRAPLSFTLIYPALTVFVALLIFFSFRWHHKQELEKKFFFVMSDSIGLVAFSIAGALLGITHEFNLFGVTILSFVTAVGGGIIRDVMINEVPSILISDFYGSIAVAIALMLYGINLLDILNFWTISLTAILSLSLRLLAYYRSWHLPNL